MDIVTIEAVVNSAERIGFLIFLRSESFSI